MEVVLAARHRRCRRTDSLEPRTSSLLAELGGLQIVPKEMVVSAVGKRMCSGWLDHDSSALALEHFLHLEEGPEAVRNAALRSLSDVVVEAPKAGSVLVGHTHFVRSGVVACRMFGKGLLTVVGLVLQLPWLFALARQLVDVLTWLC